MTKVKYLIKKITLALIPSPIRNWMIESFMENKGIYYSQEGEDIILERIFGAQSSGFYLDVGAHHPTRFSNTHKLYLRGWNGINIDATPGSMIPFRKLRKRDINLESGVSDTEGKITYYQFNEPAINTFSKERSEFVLAKSNYKLIATVDVQTRRLENILKDHLSENQSIDLLTIDVEGLDFAILGSNNWNTHRPRVILVEELENTLEKVLTSKTYLFLSSKKYHLFSKMFNTLIFIDSTKK